MARTRDSRGHHREQRSMGRLGAAVGLVLLLGCAAPAAWAYPAFRDEIPNGLRSVEYDTVQVEALGHVNRRGGGPVNAFGEDFKKAGFTWTQELCNGDSDGDGQSNGFELGDPCCVWQVGQLPMRQWSLSHPGDENSKTPVAFNYKAVCEDRRGNDEFWRFYFSTNGTGYVYKPFWQDVHDWWQGVDTAQFTAMLNPFASSDVFMRSSKNFFSMLVGVCTVWTLAVLGLGHRVCCPRRCQRTGAKPLSWRAHLLLVAAAYIYTDWMSGLLHVVLDNPVMNTWPLVGPEAKAFQGHHFDPTAVARGPILDFLREHHILVFLVQLLYLVFRPSSKGLMWFSFHFTWLSHFMMASHRWTHTNPKYLAWPVQKAMDWGFLMTTQHHSEHHASFDCNFCIFSGWMNPLLNRLVHIVHWRSPLWLFILVGFAFAPMLLTVDSVRAHLTRKTKRGLQRVARAVGRLVQRWRTGSAGGVGSRVTRNRAVVGGAATSGDAVGVGMGAGAGEGGAGTGAAARVVTETPMAVTEHLCIFYKETLLTSRPMGRRAAVAAVFVGGCVAAHLVFLCFSSGNAPALVLLHIACMATGTLVFAVAGVTAYAWNVLAPTGPGWLSRKAERRRVHRAANITAAALLGVGLGAVLLHSASADYSLFFAPGTHVTYGVLSLLGVAAQATSGLAKFADLTSPQPRADGGLTAPPRKRFRWHGWVGWWVFLAMLLAVNSGALESGLLTQMVGPLMAVQTGLFVVLALVAFALGKLPAWSIHLENPGVYLLKEYLAIAPEFVTNAVTALPGCASCRTGKAAAKRAKA